MFKNIESPKMISKRLKGHYLRSYEQFYKKTDFKGDFQAKSERKNRIYQDIFEYTKKKRSKNGILASESSRKEEL